MKKQTTVLIDDKKIIVEKLPLGKYAELLAAVKELPKHLSQFKDAKQGEIVTLLPQIISESYPDFVAILEIATPLKREEIDAIGLDDAVNLVLAVIEVNNYRDIYAAAKKALHQTPTS